MGEVDTLELNWTSTISPCMTRIMGGSVAVTVRPGDDRVSNCCGVCPEEVHGILNAVPFFDYCSGIVRDGYMHLFHFETVAFIDEDLIANCTGITCRRRCYRQPVA